VIKTVIRMMVNMKMATIHHERGMEVVIPVMEPIITKEAIIATTVLTIIMIVLPIGMTAETMAVKTIQPELKMEMVTRTRVGATIIQINLQTGTRTRAGITAKILQPGYRI
jgi:hypothetical protein